MSAIPFLSYKKEARLLGKSVKAEVEKGFARTAFDRESVDPEAQINLVNRTIGPVWALKTQTGLIQVVLIMPKGNQG